jgi:hypothetical protein
MKYGKLYKNLRIFSKNYKRFNFDEIIMKISLFIEKSSILSKI